MAKIQIAGAGGAPSNNFIKSLRESTRNDYIIGTSSIAADLFLADVNERYTVPFANAADYEEKLLRLLAKVKPDFLHIQNDYEIAAVAKFRDKITNLGIKLYLPATETIENCVSKDKSYNIWKAAGLPVPETIKLNNPDDLKHAFDILGSKIWIRAVDGAGGRGALPADNYEFARIWIDRYKGWGNFTASELLSERTVTWQSIWHQGELVVAQTRRRHSWNFGNRTLSGVTGITGVGETFSCPIVDRTAQDSILSMDNCPHGIFSVDMTYSFDGIPKITEINIGRFFTTHYFFTKAGINFPEIFCNIALDDKFPVLEKKINPLPDGLIWIRGMDVEPHLTTAAELEKLQNTLHEI